MAGEYTIPRKKTNRAFQLSAELVANQDIEKTVHHGALTVYKWIREHPGNIYKLEPKIPDDFDKQNLKIFYAKNKHFCCQMEHADSELLGREWTTEVEIVQRDEKVLLGVKISYTTPEGTSYDRNIFSVPNFIWQLLKKNTIKDVRDLKTSVLEADTQERLEELYDLLTDERRLFPVIVITDSNYDFDGKPKPLIDPRIFFARPSEGDDSYRYKVGLVAHVAHIPFDMCLRWKELVGEGWDVYNGAVRTYYENLNFDNVDFYNHPLRTAKSIAAFEYVDRQLFGVEAFIEFLSDKIVANNTRLYIDWKSRGHKFFKAAKDDAINAQLKSHEDQSLDIAEEMYGDVIAERDKEIAELKQKIEGYKEDIENLKAALDDQKRENFSQAHYVDKLLDKLNNAGKIVDIIPKEADCKLKDIPSWVETYFPDKIFLQPKVINSLKTMKHERPRLFYEALQLLGTEYWQMRQKNRPPDAYAKFNDKCDALHLKKSPATTEVSAGMMDDEYNPPYKGKKIPPKEIDHLTHGNSRDAQYIFRIYFSWDEEDNQVVVTWLESHLDTPAT